MRTRWQRRSPAAGRSGCCERRSSARSRILSTVAVATVCRSAQNVQISRYAGGNPALRGGEVLWTDAAGEVGGAGLRCATPESVGEIPGGGFGFADLDVARADEGHVIVAGWRIVVAVARGCDRVVAGSEEPQRIARL